MFSFIFSYCSNICCYLMFKAKRTPLKVHPLTGGLVQYKQLLDQLDPISDSVIKQVEDITNKVNQGASIESLVKKAKKRAALELKKNR